MYCNRFICSAICIAGLLSFSVVSTCQTTVTSRLKLLTTEVSLERPERTDHIKVSPDNAHVAYVTTRASKDALLLDGTLGNTYDYISPSSVVFSPDSKHVAYQAKRAGKWVVVVDGIEGKQYDSLGPGIAAVFSPDGKHVAYQVRRGNKSLLVKDGAEGKEENLILPNSIVFSPDSRHFVYEVRRWYERAGSQADGT